MGPEYVEYIAASRLLSAWEAKTRVMQVNKKGRKHLPVR